MNEQPLGRLERLDLRQAWKSESSDFTPWLGREENLKLLGDTVGMDLVLESQEKAVGPFRADLRCKNTLDDSWVLIENQLAKTDHTHLGQILTYAAGLKASTIIWIAERFIEEHRAAIDWLNEITDEDFNFLGLEVELWRIGNSVPAPKFNIVCKPNDWTREIKNQVKEGELTEARQLQLRYWTAFAEFMKSNNQIRCPRPQAKHWMGHPIGSGRAHISSIASFWDSEKNVSGSENRVELCLKGPTHSEWFKHLKTEREAIESEVDQGLFWYSREEAKMSRVYVRKAADLQDEKCWPEQFEWLRKNLEVFTRVFGPRVKALARGE